METRSNSYLGLLFVHLASGVAEISRQTEIRYFAAAVVIDENVSRGQITMNYLQNLSKI